MHKDFEGVPYKGVPRPQKSCLKEPFLVKHQVKNRSLGTVWHYFHLFIIFLPKSPCESLISCYNN